MTLAVAALAAIVVACALYLVFWPSPIEPRVWAPAPDRGHSGRFARNDRLSNLRRIDLGGAVGPEHIAFGPDGKLYTGVVGGDILRVNPDGGERETFANTGGRVLGLAFDAAGRLIGADSYRGLVAVAPDRSVRLLADEVEGTPILFANAVVVAANGLIYFTDSSRRFPPKVWGGTMEACAPDVLEQSATGRLLVHDAKTGETRLVAAGLSFANGVALSSDQSALFVAETGRYRIWRIPVASRALDLSIGANGGASVLFDNLPGFPDNLMRGLPGKDGRPRVWVGLTKPRNPIIDKMAGSPFLRKAALKLPDALKPIPKDHGHIFAFTDDGEVVADLQDPSGSFPETTAATEFGDRLYVASLTAKEIGWMPRPE